MTSAPDIFAEARIKITIADAWQLLNLPGNPKASCRSPFREDNKPSFSIHTNGTAWTDHSTGDGGDVVEFIRHAIGGDHKEVRQWLLAHIGTTGTPSKPSKPSAQPKRIEWPGELIEGTSATWKAFADHRGITYPAVHAMIHAGMLRFTVANGRKCFVITDASHRAAEIRALDGKPFGESKTFPLRGVDKSWLPGLAMVERSPKSSSVLITEGATDLISACDLLARYTRNEGGKQAWTPIALLGAGCRNLHPDAATILRGRHVRLVPDADPAGDQMADHWQALLRKIGCAVDVVTLPPKTDITDHLTSLSPSELFSK